MFDRVKNVAICINATLAGIFFLSRNEVCLKKNQHHHHCRWPPARMAISAPLNVGSPPPREMQTWPGPFARGGGMPNIGIGKGNGKLESVEGHFALCAKCPLTLCEPKI